MIIKLLVKGGDMKPSPAIGQKLGPLGINIGKIISEVNKATSSFRDMKVPVTLDIDSKTKNFTTKVSTPPTAEILKKELELAKGSGQPQKYKMANAAIEQIIKVAKIKQQDMLVNSFEAAIKNVLGSCVSLGILVETQDPKEIIKEIDQGKYKDVFDKEPSKEKLDKLKKDFAVIKSKQDELFKKEEEAKLKAEEAKAAKAAAAPTAPTAAAPTAAAKPTAPAAAKPEKK